MPRRAKPALLRTIANIRELQRVAAQGEAARAAASLREAERLLAERQTVCRAAEDGWRGSLEGRPLNVDAARLWSAALLGEEVRVRRASDYSSEAGEELDRRNDDWRFATARRDTARQLARASLRAHIRAREETALQDASDLHGQRKAMP